jgi:hypothetical protein
MSGIMSMVLGARTAIAAAVDEFFNRVTLLLSGDGTNGAQNNTFLDSSTNNFTITRNGNTTQGTFSPFSQTGWSNYFDGASYLTPSSSPMALGSGAYTVEFWINPTVLAAGSYHVLAANATNGFVVVINNAKISINKFGVGDVLAYNTALTLNTWTHVALVRTGTGTNQTQIYVNGASVATGTDSNNWTVTTSTAIGANSSGTPSQYINGYLSNLRICGVAVYTSAFTPSTTPLTTTSQGASSCTFLTSQDNKFKDNGSTAATFTTAGTPSVQAFSPFAPTAAYSAATNGGSGYFDGTGDYLSVADSADFNLGTNDWTIESWFYATAYSVDYPRLWGQSTAGGTGNNSVGLFFQTQGDGSNINLRWGTTSNQTNDSGAITINATKNQWHHIAVVRDGNTMRLYFNGVQKYSTSVTGVTFYNSTAAFAIGANSSGGELWQGYISDVRLVNGTCLYTGGTTFTPPTAPLTAVTNTKLLTNFTNAGITDATAKNDLETVGNAQISTTQSKFGGASMSFDGSSTVPMPARQTLALGSGNWTIECWVRLGSTGTETTIGQSKNYYTAGFNGNFVFRVGTSNLWRSFDGQSSQATIDGTYSWSTGQWYHVAWVRNGSTVTVYRDGTSLGSTTDSKTLNDSANGITLGSSLNAYVDDLRITVGVARYTANFTAPTVAFPLS